MRSIKVGQVYRYKFSDGEIIYERVTKVHGASSDTVIIRIENQQDFSIGEVGCISIDELDSLTLMLDFNDYYEEIAPKTPTKQ